MFGVYTKRLPKFPFISKIKTDTPRNLIDEFFFLILIVRRAFHKKHFQQNLGVPGQFLKKWKFCKHNLKQERK